VKRRYIIGLTGALLAGRAFVTVCHGGSIETPALDGRAVTKIEIFVHGGLTPYKEFNDPAEIAKVVTFVNAHRAGWSKPMFESPMSQVIAWFFIGTRQELGFGVESNFFWTPPNLSQGASHEDRKRLMETLGLDDALLGP
jgi:hypothetical protein